MAKHKRLVDSDDICRIPVDRIVFQDDTGKEYMIKIPSIVSLFWSKKLQESFKKDPDRTYSVSDLIELMEIKCSPSALRNYIERLEVFDHIEDGIRLSEIRKTEKGITSMNVSKLNPLVKYIFIAVDSMKQEFKNAKK